MRIGINARLLAEETLRGWNRYTVNLAAALLDLGHDLVLLSDRPLHPAHLARFPPDRLVVRIAPPMRYLAWEQRWLPRLCRDDRVDVLHTPFNYNLPWRSPVARVLTLHDAIYHLFELPRMRFRDRFRRRTIAVRLHHWAARTRAERIIAVSGHARDDLVGRLGVDARKVRVVPEAADEEFSRPIAPARRAEVRRRLGLASPYVVYVGGLDPRKNVPFLLRAFAEADRGGVDLAVAGGRPDENEAMGSLAGALGIAERVRLLGWVAEDDLAPIYAEALAYVNPSRYEGFGLQLCEAMAAGCPTLAARATSLPEVLGPGGETFAIDDPGELIGLLRRAIDDPAYRADLAARATKRSGDFSWRRTAEMTVEVYREAIRARKKAPRPR